jgi:hypothetical protein
MYPAIQCLSAAEVRECARSAVNWRRQVWGRPERQEAPPAPVEPVAPPAPPPLIMMPTGTSSTTRRLIAAILAESAKHFGVSVDAVIGRSRLMPIVRARQVSAYLIHENTKLSYPRIGGVLGRDHTTILHACRVVSDCSPVLLEAAAKVAAAVQDALAEEERADG